MARVIEAEEFVLRGADGSIRGRLALDSKGEPFLQLSGANESTVTIMTTGLSFLDPEVVERIGLSYLSGCSLNFDDSDGKQRASLTVSDTGHAWLTLLDARGESRLSMGLDEEGNPHVWLLDGKGRLLWTALPVD